MGVRMCQEALEMMCGPPNDVARSPTDDAVLLIHGARSPRAAARRPARRLKQELQRVSKKNGARVQKPLMSGEK
jgi:hypothetical protein